MKPNAFHSVDGVVQDNSFFNWHNQNMNSYLRLKDIAHIQKNSEIDPQNLFFSS